MFTVPFIIVVFVFYGLLTCFIETIYPFLETIYPIKIASFVILLNSPVRSSFTYRFKLLDILHFMGLETFKLLNIFLEISYLVKGLFIFPFFYI